METKAFDNGYVGYRVNTIKEVINAQAAGLKICNEDGYYFNNYIEVVNPETGNEEERTPTDDEIFQNIQEAMENECQLYATFYLDCGKVVDDKATTLQSDFYIGEPVYYMSDNRVALGEIVQIDMAYGKGCKNQKVKKEKYLVYRYAKNKYTTVEEKILNEGEVFDSLGKITDYLQCNVKRGE